MYFLQLGYVVNIAGPQNCECQIAILCCLRQQSLHDTSVGQFILGHGGCKAVEWNIQSCQYSTVVFFLIMKRLFSSAPVANVVGQL